MARDIFDPARFTSCPVKCIQNNADSISNTEKGRFQKVLSKISKFDPASKYLTKGMSLLKISNRISESRVIPKQFAKGINGVVDHYAIQPLLNITDRVNPYMAGKTRDSLENLSGLVRTGNLKLSNVESIAKELSNVAKFAENVFTVPDGVGEDDPCVCEEVVNQAKYIADHYFPKYSSWFCVEFEGLEEYTKQIAENLQLDNPLDPFAFLCTKTSRPKVKFEIEEINRYGQRVYVQKRSEYEPLDMSFIDDDQNATHNAMSLLMSLLIPNSNLDHSPRLKDVMAYTGGISAYAGSMSAYPSGPNGNTRQFLLERINVYQMFRWGSYVNRYTYHNPIVSSLAMSDSDTTGNTESSIDMTFRYGSVKLDTFSISDPDNAQQDGRGNPFTRFETMNVGSQGAASTMLSGDGSQKAPKSFMGGPYSTAQRLAKYKVPLSTKPSFIDNVKANIKAMVKKGLKSFADYAKGKLDSLEKGAKNLLSGVVGPLADTVQSIGSGLKTAFSVNIGMGLGLTSGFSSAISNVKNSILNSEFVQKITTPLALLKPSTDPTTSPIDLNVKANTASNGALGVKEAVTNREDRLL